MWCRREDAIESEAERVSVFEILTREFLDELPLTEPEVAFPMIVRRAFEHVSRAAPGSRDSDEARWEIYRDTQHTAMNAIVGAARRLGVEPFASMDVPRRSGFNARSSQISKPTLTTTSPKA